MLVVTRYRVAATDVPGFLAEARRALDVLTDRPGCRGGELGRAVDDAGLFVLSSRWDDVGSYRRALSSLDVKLTAVPLLSQAIDEATAFEVLRRVGPDGSVDAESALAADAATVGLGEAAAPRVPREPS